jgi:hypothetical protein
MKQRNVVHLAMATLFVLFFASAARADSVDVTLIETSQTATAGSTITFDATLSNRSSTDTIFLNGDSSITSSLLLTVDDTPFLTNFPLSLDPSEVSGPYALFNVIIDPSTPAGSYDFNSFSILGGLDGNTFDTIGTADFSLTVASTVPITEPGTLVLVFSGLLAIGTLTRLGQVRKSSRVLGLVATLRHKLWRTVLATPPYRKYYLYAAPPEEHLQVLPQILSIYAITYYLGSITRYRPHHFDAILSSSFGPFIEAFLNDQPSQFIYLMASEFAEKEVTKAAIV